MTDEDKTCSGSLVLDLKILRFNMSTVYNPKNINIVQPDHG